MRKILLGLIGFLFAFSSSGQELTVDVEVDTLKVIQTVQIPTKEICFGIRYGKVFFSKASLIEAWDNELALWEDELDKASQKNDWEVENYKLSESYLEFVKRQDKIFYEYIPTDYDLDFQTPNIEKQRPQPDTLFYMEPHLKEIACNLLELGEFEIQVDNKKVDKVIKAKVSRISKYSETIATEYIVNDSIYFWICPPIIHSDFAFDEY